MDTKLVTKILSQEELVINFNYKNSFYLTIGLINIFKIKFLVSLEFSVLSLSADGKKVLIRFDVKEVSQITFK